MNNPPEKIPVIGLQVAVTSYDEATRWSREKAGLGDRAYTVSAANTHVAAHARRNKDFAAAMQRFDLICPDGMPLVWLLNSQVEEGKKLSERVYGPDLMLSVLEATSGMEGEGHFFLGGKQETLDQLVNRFSSNQIAGTYSPPFGDWDDVENQKIIQLIRESGAGFVWLGLGCPKQEDWIARHLDDLPPAVYFAVGAAFAFHTGEVKQAPHLFQKFGLEWFYRLCAEPRRLWKRYAVYNSLFLYYALKDHISSP